MSATTKSAHTPGPWRLGPIHSDGSFAIHSNKGSIVHAIPFGSTLQDRDANARLIAAAPEMLEALELVHQALADYCDEHDGKHAVRPETQSLLFRLIAKAKGEL